MVSYSLSIKFFIIGLRTGTDQLRASESMHGMSDVTSGCSFAVRKVWQNQQVGGLKCAHGYNYADLSDHGDKQKTWTLTTVCEE